MTSSSVFLAFCLRINRYGIAKLFRGSQVQGDMIQTTKAFCQLAPSSWWGPCCYKHDSGGLGKCGHLPEQFLCHPNSSGHMRRNQEGGGLEPLTSENTGNHMWARLLGAP